VIHFFIGEIAVTVIVDDDDFPPPLREFLPGLDLAMGPAVVCCRSCAPATCERAMPD
jgi:hypothetical protein